MNRLRSVQQSDASKKQQVLNRMETYEHLSPDQQKQADSLYQAVSRTATGPAEPGFAGL